MPDTLEDSLPRQQIVWESRPLLRRLYRECHELVAARLAPVAGPTVELGGGIGRFKDVVPDAVVTDVEPTAWADAVVNAERLLFADRSVGNLVMIDVFHHLARPARFLDEAARVLAPGGRVVLLEPYCSPLTSTPTPLESSRAASRSPVPQPSSRTEAPRGTGKRKMDSISR